MSKEENIEEIKKEDEKVVEEKVKEDKTEETEKDDEEENQKIDDSEIDMDKLKELIKSTYNDIGYIPFEFRNGEKVQLTLSLKGLNSLRNLYPNTFEIASRVILYGATDVWEFVHTIYAAYLCGLDDIKKSISIDNFIDNIEGSTAVLYAIESVLISRL